MPSEQDRPDVARFRARWKKYQAKLDPTRLVFIDETWTKTNMAPLRGWCALGQRLTAKVPHGQWKTMTFLAALRHDRIDAPFVFRASDMPASAPDVGTGAVPMSRTATPAPVLTIAEPPRKGVMEKVRGFFASIFK